MRKSAAILILSGLFLISPLTLAQEQVPAQEQAKTYSGFDRFVDNVKMFFSFRDKKVMLALDIRDKELSSAIVNTENGDNAKAEKNLERARKKLQFVQNKVSKDIAENVKTNINKTINKIKKDENLSHNIETYLLEEEKTQLTAELVVETDKKDGKIGENKVEITVNGDDGQTKIMEIKGRITDIDNQITERTVKNVIIEEEANDGAGGLVPEIKTDTATTEEKKNFIKKEITEEDEIINVVEDIVKDDKIQIDNKENEDVSSAANNIDGKIDDGPGEPGVVNKD